MLTEQQRAALKQAAADAITCELATGCPALLTVCQWACESGWGSKQPGNNAFGLKAVKDSYGVQWLPTHEFVNGKEETFTLAFATFPSLAACFIEHAELITKGAPYTRAWRQYCDDKDVFKLIGNIAPIYATAPNYAQTLKDVASMPEVQQAVMVSA